MPKHERRFTGFDDKIIAMYARGMTVREIQGYLVEIYGTEVSPEFISKVSDEVMAEVTAWQSRPLEPLYPVIFFDALRVKIRDDAVVRNKAEYLALGVRPDGARAVLGIWIEQTEGAKFCKTHARALDPQACAALLALHLSVGKYAQWGGVSLRPFKTASQFQPRFRNRRACATYTYTSRRRPRRRCRLHRPECVVRPAPRSANPRSRNG